MLDHGSPVTTTLIDRRKWRQRPAHVRIGAAHEFVGYEIRLSHNSPDERTASRALGDRYGRCNTKTTLLMALLRAPDIPCRFHGFPTHKRLERGVVPKLVYSIIPDNILHSWVELLHRGRWVSLEEFILDEPIFYSHQKAFPGRNSLCAIGTGKDCLQMPDVQWTGKDTYIQKTGVNPDFGTFDTPDEYYHEYKQLTGPCSFLFRHVIRHWMNRHVECMRFGNVPPMPGILWRNSERASQSYVA